MAANYSSPLPPLTLSPSCFSSSRGKGESQRPFAAVPQEDKRCPAPAHNYHLHLLMNWSLSRIGVVWKNPQHLLANPSYSQHTAGWLNLHFLGSAWSYTRCMLSGLSLPWNRCRQREDLQLQGRLGFIALSPARGYSAEMVGLSSSSLLG